MKRLVQTDMGCAGETHTDVKDLLQNKDVKYLFHSLLITCENITVQTNCVN